MSELKKLKISALFVEDDKETRDILESRFSRYIEDLICVDSPKKALELIEKRTFDVVVTDIMMPEGIDGLEMAKVIKQKDSEVHIIVTSAYSDINFFTRAIEAGVDRYLIKPLKAKTLKDILNNIEKIVTKKREFDRQKKLLLEYNHAVDVSAIVSKGDVKGNIIYVNDKFCEISGYEREELIGKPHSIVRHPATSSRVFEEMWSTILDKKVWKGRITNRKKDGSRYIVETTISPIVDEDGNILEFFSIRNDVSKFVEQGREIKRHEEEKLEQEQRHLEELNRSKDALLSIFTHELKTPLNAIINLSAIAQNRLKNDKEDVDVDEILEYLEVVCDNGKYMLSEVLNILEILAMKSKKSKISMTKFDISEIIRDIFIQQERSIDSRKIFVDLRFSKNLFVYSDQKKFSQILENIISNAIKYSKDMICVEVCEDCEYYRISIEDNGNGFKDISRVTDMFAQSDDSLLKRESSGIGLGLHFVILAAKELDIGFDIGSSKVLGGAKIELIIKRYGDGL